MELNLSISSELCLFLVNCMIFEVPEGLPKILCTVYAQEKNMVKN